MNTTKTDKIMMGLGIVLCIGAVALLTTLETIDIVIILALFVAGATSLITGFSKYLGYRKSSRTDERIRKLSAFATTYSWFITFVLVNILFLLDYFDRLTITVSQTLGLIFFVMLLTMVGMNMYFKRKGYAE
jgi:drug/metabolite transporter (DMT)-like permease